MWKYLLHEHEKRDSSDKPPSWLILRTEFPELHSVKAYNNKVRVVNNGLLDGKIGH